MTKVTKNQLHACPDVILYTKKRMDRKMPSLV